MEKATMQVPGPADSAGQRGEAGPAQGARPASAAGGPGPAMVRARPAAQWPLERTHEREVILAAALAALARVMRETGRPRVDGTLADFDQRGEELRVYRNEWTGRFAVVLHRKER